MPTTTSLIAQSMIDAAKIGIFLGNKLAEDIPADKFARFITNSGSPVVANHPAFAYGHLALYPAKIAGFLGGDPAPLEAPKGWAEILEQDLECFDDPDGSIYPSKDIVMGSFSGGYTSVLEIVAKTDDTVFAQDNPIERARDRFPTVGVMVQFMLTSHVAFHLGQVSTWRRCNGLGSVM